MKMLLQTLDAFASSLYVPLCLYALCGLLFWCCDCCMSKGRKPFFLFSFPIILIFSGGFFFINTVSKRYMVFLTVPALLCAGYFIRQSAEFDFRNFRLPASLLAFWEKHRAKAACFFFCVLLFLFIGKDLHVNPYADAMVRLGETVRKDACGQPPPVHLSVWSDSFHRVGHYCRSPVKELCLLPVGFAAGEGNAAVLENLKTCNFPFYVVRKIPANAARDMQNPYLTKIFESFDSRRRNRLLQCWRCKMTADPPEMAASGAGNLFLNGDLSRKYLLAQRYPNVRRYLLAQGKTYFVDENICVPENLIVGGIFSPQDDKMQCGYAGEFFRVSAGSFFSLYSQQKFKAGTYCFSILACPEEKSNFRMGISNLTPTGFRCKQLGMFQTGENGKDHVFSVLIEPSDLMADDFQVMFLLAEGSVRIKKIFVNRIQEEKKE